VTKTRLLILLAALAFASPAVAAPPKVDARAYLVMNSATGEVLAARDDRARLPIASITKLMTALVVLDRVELDELVTVGPSASAIGESTIQLRPGERLPVRDLVAAALIQSANDAANALAEYVGGGDKSRFVELMNARAARLGLRDTHFVRPDGLDAAGGYSSARDVTTLGRVAMRSPVIRSIVDDRTASIAGGRTLHTWNDLLSTFPRLIGVKTGHTTAAGWSQVAAARGRGITVYATILGSPTRARRNRDLAALLAWGLSRYRVVEAVAPGRVYARVAVAYGRAPVGLVTARPLLRSVRVDRALVERVVAPAQVELPVRRGERLGAVQIWSRGQLLGSRPLVADRSVSRPGLGGRVDWYAKRTAKRFWGLIA
jgi:D-alanyl-D-alanine carboxypeptidase (penicillin-binding protein 5/6)